MARLRLPKSLTIDCEDTQGSILASLVNGVIVNSSTAHVKLRGLSINGAGNGINCVRVIAAASVVLDEVVCANFSQHGVSVENSSGVLKLAIWNSSFRNNTGNGVNTFETGTGSAQVAIETSLCRAEWRRSQHRCSDDGFDRRLDRQSEHDRYSGR
jgi:hypothetical protein